MRLLLLFLLLQPVSAADVTINAIVTGKSGAVRELTAKDFTVSLDGKDQAVSEAALAPAKRFLVLLLDTGTISAGDQARILKHLGQFLDASMNPQRYFAVLRYHVGMEVLQPFTTDVARLKAALLKAGASALTGSGEQGLLSSGFSSDTGRRNAATPQGPPAQAVAGQDSQAASGVQRAQTLLQSLGGMASSLAPVRGRKVVLFITGGGYAINSSSDIDAVLQPAMSALNRADVALYGVTNDSSLSNLLSDRTGGFASRITESLPETLTRFAEDLDSTYTLTLPAAAGCHQLKVKAAKGLDVHSRREICAVRQAEAPAGSGPGGMTVSAQVPYYYIAANRARAHVALEIVPAGLKFSKQRGRFVAELNIVIAGAASSSEVVPLALDKQEQVDAFLKQAFHYDTQVELPSGKHELQVAVGAGDAFGRVSVPVEIAAWDGARLALGSLAFGRIRRGGGSGLIMGLDPALLEGRTPLTVGNTQVTPLGTARFPANASAVVYTEIDGPPGTMLQLRYVDRKTGAIKMDSGQVPAAPYARAGSAVIPVAFDVPIRDLGPGAYQVLIRVSQGASAVIGSSNFEIY